MAEQSSNKLISALLGETVSKEFPFGKHKVVLRTLEQDEIDEVMLKVARMDFSMIELQKIPVLARSLVSIDGASVATFQEVRDAIKKNPKTDIVVIIEGVLGKFDQGVINILYNLYLELLDIVDKERQELKNFSRVQSADPSTESAKI